MGFSTGTLSAERAEKQSEIKVKIHKRTRFSCGGIGIQGSLLAFGFNSL